MKNKRALTNLYSARPTWLELAHKKLDEAVFTAYGWPGDLFDFFVSREPFMASHDFENL